jgi:hypothetical protein
MARLTSLRALLPTSFSRLLHATKSAVVMLVLLSALLVLLSPGAGRAGGPPPPCNIGVITNSGPPQITGSTTVGSILTHTTYGNWSSCGEPINGYMIEWLQDANVISGESSPSYTTRTADIGHYVRSGVQACNADGCYGTYVLSNQIGPISCPAPTNTGAPTISGVGAIGSPETTSTGSWSSACAVSSYNYEWLRDGVSIGVNSSSYTPTNADWQQTLESAVQACNAYACSGFVGSSNTLTIQVRIDENSSGNYVVFENNQAQMWIGLRCGLRSEAIGDWKPVNMQTGPGYISKLIRTVGNGGGGPKVLEEPNDPNLKGGAHNLIPLLQGIGVFGTHLGFGTNYGIANGDYCTSDMPPNPPAYAGVSSTTVVASPTVTNGDTGSVTVDAYLGDGTSNLLKVRYDIRVHPSVVNQWTTVTILCGNGVCTPGRTYFVKEPKIVVDLNGSQNDYTRVSCWDTSASWMSAAMGENLPSTPTQYTKWAFSDPAPPPLGSGTMKCLSGSPASTRMRLLFDYGTPNDGINTPEPSGCTAPVFSTDQTCFIAVGRSFTPPGGPGTTLDVWENGGSSFAGTSGSFDQWAATYPTYSGRSHLGTTNDCGNPADNSNSTSGNDRRRWEVYGYSPNELGRNERGGILKAWDGGTGPGNCFSLFGQLGPANSTWGAFTAYSFGPGWGNWTNPN